jgi:hypothetical protein
MTKAVNDNSLPTTGRQWVLRGNGSFDKLSLEEHAEVPKVGDNEVLVHSESRFEAVARLLLNQSHALRRQPCWAYGAVAAQR